MKEQKPAKQGKKPTPVKDEPVVEEVKVLEPVADKTEDKPKAKAPTAKNPSEKKNIVISETIYKSYGKVVDAIKSELDELSKLAVANQNQTEVDNAKLTADYDAAVIAANSKLDSVTDKVKKDNVKAEELFTKANAAIDKTKSEEIQSIDPRVKENNDSSDKSKKIALDKLNSAEKATVEFEAANKAQYDKAIQEELTRKAEVDSKRADLILSEDKEYEDICLNMKNAYDADIQSLNDQIAAMHNSYFEKVQNVNDTYNQEIEAINLSENALKEKVSERLAQYESIYNANMVKFNNELDTATNAQNKAGVNEAKKGLKATSNQYSSEKADAQKELDKAKAINDKTKSSKAKELENNLYNMKQEFIKSIPPVENKIRLRQYQYDVDVLKALNSKKQQDNARELAVFSETSENSFINSTIDKEYKEGLLQAENKKEVYKGKYDLDLKLINVTNEVFKANEEFKAQVVSLKEELNKKRALNEKLQSLEKSDNELKLATINNKFTLIDKANDLKYNIMSARFNYVFASVNKYYEILNKRNGFSIEELMNLNSNINSANTSFTDEEAYELYNASFEGYVKDTEVAEKGVLANKNNNIAKNQKDILALAAARYALEKENLNAAWKSELARQSSDSLNNIENLNKELADTEESIKNRLSQAESNLETKLNQLTTIQNDSVKTFNDYEADSLTTLNNSVKAITDKLEQEKLMIKEKYSQLKAQKEENNQTLKAEVDAKLKEQANLNARSEKTTLKTIKVLLKKGKVVDGTRWWVIEV